MLARIQHSSWLVVVIVFLTLFTDSLLLTLVDPILPDMLRQIDNITASADQTMLINSDGRYGVLVASKAAAQFISSPCVAFLVTRFGYRRPMLVGDILLLVSTIVFGFGNSYTILLATRFVQGAASSVTAVTGLGLLAATFTDNIERGKIMGISIAGLSLGIIVGPVYGSILYQFFGQRVPFLVLAAMIFLTLSLQLITLQKETTIKNHQVSSIFQLIADPYILLVAGTIFLLNLDVSVILAFLPIRLIELEDPQTWKLGIVVLPTSIGYLLASLVIPQTITFLPRWLCGMMGLLISAATMVALAFARTFILMLGVTTCLGIALGMVSTSMQPLFAQLADIRHTSVYGNVYAISDMSVCLAMCVGPLIGGVVLYNLGFQWLVVGVAVLNCSYSVLCPLLQNVLSPTCANGARGAVTPDEKSPLLGDRRNSVQTCSRSSSVFRSHSVITSDMQHDVGKVPTQYPDDMTGEIRRTENY